MFSVNMPGAPPSEKALRIAQAGLEHWHPGYGSRAQAFLDAALAVQAGGKEERLFLRSFPCGLNDQRWVEVLYYTCIFASYTAASEEQMNLEEIVSMHVFEFIQIDSYGCRVNHGIDQFTAQITDPIWRILSPPFDWLCSCRKLLLLDCDEPQNSAARAPARKRIGTYRLRKIKTWLERSPETAFRYL